MPQRRVAPSKLAFNGVSPGQTATVELERFGTYFDVDLEYYDSGKTVGNEDTQATIEADTSKITISLDGISQRSFTAAQLYKIHAFKGLAFEAGTIPIYFAEPQRVMTVDEDATAWGMAGVGQFTIDVEIDATATSPSLKAIPTKLPSRDLQPGQIVTWRNWQVITTGVGLNTAIYYGDAKHKIQAIHCFSSNINGVKIKRGDTVLLDVTKAQLERRYTRRGYAPQAGMFTISPEAFTGRLLDGMERQDPITGGYPPLDFEFDMAAGETFDCIIEELGARRV